MGLLFAALVLARGGTARLNRGVVEAVLPTSERGGRFGAITFGHVILGRSEDVLNRLRPHELEHVKQYERWGPTFFLAYPASSLWQLLRGRNPYWFNCFEIQARQRCASADDGDMVAQARRS